jgi:hypothetical protein
MPILLLDVQLLLIPSSSQSSSSAHTDPAKLYLYYPIILNILICNISISTLTLLMLLISSFFL